MFSYQRVLGRMAVATLAAVCYGNSLWADFVFDDSKAILNNTDVNPDTPLSKVFSDDFWGTEIMHKSSHKSYRPLTVMTFRWNVWLAGGVHPFGFHLTNVLLHVVASLLYYEVCRCFVEQKKQASGKLPWDIYSKCALVSALFFAVHPIHTESVSGIVGRADLSAAVCFFLSLLAYAKSCAGQGSFPCVLLSVLLGGVAMLFKEQGITVLGVCMVYELLMHSVVSPFELLLPHRWNWKASGVRIVTVLGCAAALLVARMATGSPEFQAVDNPASFADSLLTRVLSYNFIYALNGWLLVSPWWLCFDWSMGCVPLLYSLADGRVGAVAVFWGVAASLLLFAISGRASQFKRLVVMSLALLVVPFLPASNVFLRVGFVIAERALYLPSAGYCLLLGLALCALSKRVHKSVWYLATGLLLGIFTMRSIQRSSHWLNEEALFTEGIKVCPLNAKVLYNIGKVRADGGDSSVGEVAYREAIRLYPEYDQALNNLGNLLKETARVEEAELVLHRAVQSNPEFAAAWMNLGIVKATLNKTAEAEASYQNAIKHRNKYPDAYFNLGNLYIDEGRFEDAASAYRSAIALQRDHLSTWSNLALLYENLKMFDEAENVLREAVRIMPDGSHFCYALGVLMGKTQRYQEGVELLSKAIAMSPGNANYHANLGVVQHLSGHYSEAEESYLTALQLHPTLAIAKDNLNKLHRATKKSV